ncbi:hypothetical protein R3W88_022695 [Solanum pinnatisectum]|uniref:Uncharacterized protein n=1 Tax=Solanum pinnatisectum TaxID=50273 RepID=A0AAV9LWZ2_9SOLN|nr:hypothetical protein R3W88_022695 [Solanum pinnatisectum]
MTRSDQNKKCPCLLNTNAEMKFNRHKKYKEMLPAQKETLLLQRRTRVLESTRRLLQVSAFNNSVKSLSSTSNSPFTSTEGSFSFQVEMNYQYKKHACEVDDNCCAKLPSKY